jgi:phosphate:Na+ symporter
MSALHFILTLLGGLGLFLFGMRTMSDGIRRGSGASMRSLLGRLTRSTGLGAMTGTLVTVVLQSSSAVTVTLVSLVNAGMITVRESVGVLFGANIGTTITAWLVVLSVGGLSFGSLALPLVGLALPFFLMEGTKSRNIGQIVIGFALLFIGLGVLRDEFQTLDAAQVMGNWNFSSVGTLSMNLFLLVVGALLTALIQSSSAATALTLAAVLSGVMSLENGAAMILGENIGTTVTANLAAAVGNREARRTARIHFLFNFIGAMWVVWWLPVIVDGLTWIWSGVAGESSKDGLVLASFHTLFNVTNALLLSMFTDQLVRWSDALVRGGGVVDPVQADLNADSVRQLPPEIGIERVQQELLRSARLASRMNGLVRKMLAPIDDLEREDLLSLILRSEIRLDEAEGRISDSLHHITQLELTSELSDRIQSCMNANTDIERIGDVYKSLARKLGQREVAFSYFIPKQRERLNRMFDLVEEANELMVKSLDSGELVSSDAVAEVESRINGYRDVLREKHLKDTDRGKYPQVSGLLYHDVVTSLEEIGDRVAHVSSQFAAED